MPLSCRLGHTDRDYQLFLSVFGHYSVCVQEQATVNAVILL